MVSECHGQELKDWLPHMLGSHPGCVHRGWGVSEEEGKEEGECAGQGSKSTEQPCGLTSPG